ncbi:hypothetical protein DEJ30_10940 [Curtobacterium sp. MCPF17_003]|nr:hypothetical protein DEJ30_10940 [Curtobacterium sp. MCPF17_003]PZE71909.1 hypothetical protein DEJ27_03835 [Curtobacterium sp. MCPF17_018]PZE93772.1 hypothetical protein DEJ00_00655 [Curtobacterium sp. MCLR17_039]PZF29599.1 hypothetical protein DEJ35_10440 [Curtobacterium sp. MCPF17_051]
MYVRTAARLTECRVDTTHLELPPAIPVDRVGGPDGWLLNPFGASFESRPLPPNALSLPSSVHPHVTDGIVLVHAQITLPWFGSPAERSGSPSPRTP